MLRLTDLGPELEKLERLDDPLLRETLRSAKLRLAGVEPESAHPALVSDAPDQVFRPAQDGIGVG
jgi:hypothetical protein